MILKALGNISYMCTIRPRLMKLRALLPEAKIHPAGSRYVCSPPVYGTDIDFLIWSPVADIGAKLTLMGFEKSQFTEYFKSWNSIDDFWAWRRHNVNLIVTRSQCYAETFHTATHICKAKNLRHKEHRIAVHEGLRGNWEEHRYLVAEDNPLRSYIEQFTGPYGPTLQKAYRAKHGLTL